MTIQTYVGTFTSPLSTGQQAITGIPFQPTAVIIWTAASSSGWATADLFAMGFCAGTGSTSGITQGYVTCGSANGSSGSVGYRRYNTSAAIGLVGSTGTLYIEATLYSMDSGGFTLNWGTVSSGTQICNYMAIGGTTNAKVVGWQNNLGTVPFTQSVGVGFTPDCVIHIGASTSGGSPSNVSTGAIFATGAMDSAGNQWGECVYAQGAQATSNTGRVQLTSACLLNEPFAVNPTMVGSYSAMGANGFTINWTSMPSYQLEWISLCLEGGGEYQVGNWAKSTAAAPVSDTVSVSMFPMGVLLTTDSYTVSASGQTGLRTMVGASNSFDNGCAGVTDKHNVATTVADRFQYATASINVSNNDTETNEAVATVSAATSISPAIDSNQGIAFDGTYYYAFNTGSIYKYNSSWGYVASNTNVGTQAGVNHLGDGDYYNDGTHQRLYVVGMNSGTCSPPGWSDSRIAVFNASDLSFVEYIDISAQNFDAGGGCAVDTDDNVLWVTSWCGGGTIYKYKLSDMINGTATYLGSITPSPATSYSQGIAYYSGNLYFSYSTASFVGGGVTRMNTSGTNQLTVVPYFTFGEAEGLTVNATGIHLDIGSATTNIYTYPLTVSGSFTARWTTNNSVATQICFVAMGIPPNIAEAASVDGKLLADNSASIALDTSASVDGKLLADITPSIAFDISTSQECVVIPYISSATTGIIGGGIFTSVGVDGELLGDINASSILSTVTQPLDAIVIADIGVVVYFANNNILNTAVDGFIGGDVTATMEQTVVTGKGTGKTYWNGIDLTQAPYYAYLTSNTKYDWLDGITFIQVPTGQNTMANTSAYPSKLLLTLEYKLKPLANIGTLTGPSQTRQELQAAWNALTALTDPILQGQGQLILAEFPGSYWIAKRLQTAPNDEADYPAMADVQLEFAVTGMAYSVTESYAAESIASSYTTLTVTSNGDSLAYPLWTIHCGGNGYGGTITITNTTTGEAVSWTGWVKFGDMLGYIMDAEYGEPGTMIQTWGSVTGAWPHLVPGDNIIEVKQSPATTGSGPINGIFEVQWRDRFSRGQLVIPPIVPPIVNILPTDVVINGEDAATDGSFIFYGQLIDINLNPVRSAKVVLYASTNDISWSVVETTTTDESGNYTFNATGVYDNLTHWEVRYGGSPLYFSSTSLRIITLPRAKRVNTEISITVDTSQAPAYTFSGTVVESAHSSIVVNNILDLVALQILVPWSTWTDVPGLALGSTDNSGDYTFTYNIGPVLSNTDQTGYRAKFLGNLEFNPSVTPEEISVTAATQPVAWQPELPVPITYLIGLAPQAVNAGVLNYFAAVGYTGVILVAEANALTARKTYATELAIINSFGMSAVLDIEMVANSGGITWKEVANDTECSTFYSWFAELAAAGWPTVSSELGDTGYPYYSDNARRYFSGFINYNIPYASTWSVVSVAAAGGQNTLQVSSGAGFVNGMSIAVGQGGADSEKAVIVSGAGVAGASTLVLSAGLQHAHPIGDTVMAWPYWDVDVNTSENLFEFYWHSAVGYIEMGTTYATQIGIPCGILAYPYIDPTGGLDVFENSVNNQTPTYQSLLDWSYANGIGLTTFTFWLDPNFDQILNNGADPIYLLLFYLTQGADSVVTNLQQTYPAAGTEALTNITMLMPELTLNVIEEAPGVFVFSGTLAELLSGNPIAGADIYIQISSNGGITWTDLSVVPSVTNATGTYAGWTEEFAAGTYNIRVLSGGSSTYLNTYAPYSHYGLQLVVPPTGTTITGLTLNASSASVALNATDTFTAVLTSGATGLSGKYITIYHYDSSGTYNYDVTGETDPTGTIMFVATESISDTFQYFAYFAGDATYAAATSNEVDVTVGD